MDNSVTLNDWTTLPPEKPASGGRTLLLAGVALAVGLGIVWKIDGSRAVVLHGSLETPRKSVKAPRDAAVVTFAVSPGERVEAGAAVAIIEDRRAVDELREQQERVEQLRAAVDQARAKADIDFAWRCERLDAEIHEIKLKTAELLRAQFQLQFEEFALSDQGSEEPGRATVMLTAAADGGLKDLLPSPYLEREGEIRQAMRQEAVRNAAEVYAAQIELCDARLKELESLKAELPSKVEFASGVQQAEAQLSAAEKRLADLQMRTERLTLTAPESGVIGLIHLKPGDEVSAGETVVELLNDELPYVVATVESEHLGHLAAGKEVDLEFPGGEKRTGVIRSVPPQTSEDPADSFFGRTGYVSVTIDQKGKLWPDAPVGAVVKVRLPRKSRSGRH